MEITLRLVLEVSPTLERLVQLLARGVGGPERAVGVPEAQGAAAGSSPAAAPAAAAAGLPRQNALAAAVRKPVRGAWRTEARQALLVAGYPVGAPMHEMVKQMHALPGPPLPASPALHVRAWARGMGLNRPAGFDRVAAGKAGRAAKRASAGVPASAGPSWAEMLAWAETVDPDLVLRGSPAERLAQINDLRRLEGERAFPMPHDLAALRRAA